MPYAVRYEPEAVADLDDLPRNIRTRILRRIDWLAEHGDEVKHLVLTGNLAGLYKLRVGDYRSIYELDNIEKKIIIYRVGHRGNIYDRF